MTRIADHPIEQLFLDRWSPRALDAMEIPDKHLNTIFEAARWAPSSFNAQPWRFLYAKRESADFERFLGLLMPMNAAWANRASVLIFIVSDSLIAMKPGADPGPSHTHSFDAGAAWALMALEATKLGYAAHGMAGVEWVQAQAELGVPERFRIDAAVAIGRKDDPSVLPEPLRAREFPSGRRPIGESAYAGNFPI